MTTKRTKPGAKPVKKTAGVKPVKKTGTKPDTKKPAGTCNEHPGCEGCKDRKTAKAKKTAETKAQERAEAKKAAEAETQKAAEARRTAEVKETQKATETAMGQILNIETKKFVINSLARVDIDEVIAITEAERRTARAIAEINKNAARTIAEADKEAAEAMATADEAEAKAIAEIERRVIRETQKTILTFSSPPGETPLKEGDTCILASDEGEEYPHVMTINVITKQEPPRADCCWSIGKSIESISFHLSALRRYTPKAKN